MITFMCLPYLLVHNNNLSYSNPNTYSHSSSLSVAHWLLYTYGLVNTAINSSGYVVFEWKDDCKYSDTSANEDNSFRNHIR